MWYCARLTITASKIPLKAVVYQRQPSMASLPGRLMSTGGKLQGVNGHITLCISPVFVVSWLQLLSA